MGRQRAAALCFFGTGLRGILGNRGNIHWEIGAGGLQSSIFIPAPPSQRNAGILFLFSSDRKCRGIGSVMVSVHHGTFFSARLILL